MRSSKNTLTALFIVLVAASQAQTATAAESAEGGAKLGVTFEADLEYGGDDVATVSFSDGSSQDVKAGNGLTVAIGGQYKPDATSPFGVRATVGYKFVTTAADNADIGINRVVLELLGSYRLPNDFWFGLGLSRHTNVKFDADGFGENLDFDDATGVTGEIGWKWFALSYTKIEYTDQLGFDWDASSIGLTLTSKF